MWSTALCTLGVTKPMNLCNCLNFRQQNIHTVLRNHNIKLYLTLQISGTYLNSSNFSSFIFILRSLEERDL